jgi:hypothetical protein
LFLPKSYAKHHIKCDYLPGDTANRQNQVNQLSWSTEQENQPYEFTIEKSRDGVQFQLLATLPGVQQNSLHTYTYYDSDPGTVFYRLRVTDLVAQRTQISNIVMVQQEGNTPAIVTLQNPFSHTISFWCHTEENARAQIYLYDSYGRRVAEQQESLQAGSTLVNVSKSVHALQEGVYTLRVRVGNYEMNKKLVKSR